MTKNETSIKAIDFNDGKALNKALKAAISAVEDVYFTGEGEQSVDRLLSMLMKMRKENQGRAEELRALSN